MASLLTADDARAVARIFHEARIRWAVEHPDGAEPTAANDRLIPAPVDRGNKRNPHPGRTWVAQGGGRVSAGVESAETV